MLRVHACGGASAAGGAACRTHDGERLFRKGLVISMGCFSRKPSAPRGVSPRVFHVNGRERACVLKVRWARWRHSRKKRKRVCVSRLRFPFVLVILRRSGLANAANAATSLVTSRPLDDSTHARACHVHAGRPWCRRHRAAATTAPHHARPFLHHHARLRCLRAKQRQGPRASAF